MTSLVDSFLGTTPTVAEPVEWPDVLPDHFSYSMGSMMDRCEEQTRYRYIFGWKERPKHFLLWGTEDSKAAEHNFSQKVQTQADLQVREVEEKFVDALETATSTGQEESGYEADWGDSSLEDVKQRGTVLAGAYHRVVAPSVQPMAVEEKFELAVPWLAVPIIGYIDVRTGGAIIDRKTAGRKWTVPEGNYVAQARTYQLARHLPVHFHVSTKTKTPGVFTPKDEPTLELPFSFEAAAEAKRWIQSVARRFVRNVTDPDLGPYKPWPGARYKRQSPCQGMCGFKDRCYWWTGKEPTP